MKRLLLAPQRMGVAACILGASVLLSRFMGLARDKVIATLFGAGPEADAYFAAFIVPDFINYLLAGGYFSITLIPLISRIFDRDEDAGWRFFSTVFWWVFLASAVLCAAAFALAPQLAKLVAPGFGPAEQARLAYFLRIIVPAQVCFLPGATLTALLYWRKQFTVPALTPLVYNGCIILGGLFFGLSSPEKGMEGFCWGVLAGAFLGSFLLPWLAAGAGGLSLRFTMRDKGILAFLALALPLMLGQSVVALDEQFLRFFGSFAGEGSVSLLAYARRIMQVPVGVVAQAAGVASYPFLAALAASGQQQEFDRTLKTALQSALALIVPVCVWMAVSAEPIMRLIFVQGRFDAADAALSGILLALMMAAVPLWAVQQLMGRAFYAHENTLTPVLTGTLATALSLPVYWLLTRQFGAPGIAASSVAGVAFYTLLLCRRWQHGHGSGAMAGVIGHAGRALALCLLPAALALAADLTIRATGLVSAHPLLSAALSLAVGGCLFALAYLALAWKLVPHLLSPFLALVDRIGRRRR